MDMKNAETNTPSPKRSLESPKDGGPEKNKAQELAEKVFQEIWGVYSFSETNEFLTRLLILITESQEKEIQVKQTALQNQEEQLALLQERSRFPKGLHERAIAYVEKLNEEARKIDEII